jgi:hypothetical protein
MESTAWDLLPTPSTNLSNWFPTGTMLILVHGPRSHTSSTTLSTTSKLVLRSVYCMGLAPVLSLLVHLLVHDWYYVEFTAWASLPYF